MSERRVPLENGGKPVEATRAVPSEAAREVAAEILRTPTPGQDVTKSFFPWYKPVERDES